MYPQYNQHKINALSLEMVISQPLTQPFFVTFLILLCSGLQQEFS